MRFNFVKSSTLLSLSLACAMACVPGSDEKFSCAKADDCLDGFACYEGVCIAADKVPADPCAAVVCHVNATCAVEQEIAVCRCNPGLAGDGKEYCDAVASCATGNGGCDSNATCAEASGQISCDCNQGYSGNGYLCTANPSCAVNNGGCDTNATCAEASGQISCDCNQGYINDGNTCIAMPTCAVDNGGCDPDAECNDATGQVACTCKAGFDGDGYSCLACAPQTFTGECPGCGYSGDSWRTALNAAYNACAASCSTSCTMSSSAGDHCSIPEEVGGYRCTSICASAVCLPEADHAPGACNDGIDNDSDGQFDCDDSDCANASVCAR